MIYIYMIEREREREIKGPSSQRPYGDRGELAPLISWQPYYYYLSFIMLYIISIDGLMKTTATTTTLL